MTAKMHRDKNYIGLDLHATYIYSFAKFRPVEMYVRIKQYDSSPSILLLKILNSHFKVK